jgi:hypothetical protein
MKKAITFLLAIVLVSSLASLCSRIAFSEVQVGVKSGDWMKYDVVTEERNWTGWLRFDLYDIEAGLIKFNSTTYSSSFGYAYTSGQYNLSDISAYVVYPNDTIQTFIIPANLKTGDVLQFYGMSNITIAGETSGTYLGAGREVIYATYIPNNVSSEASRIDYKWDKTTGIVLEYTALYPDGKTTIGKIADTNIWQPEAATSSYVIYLVIIAAIVIILAVVLLWVRARGKRKISQLTPPEKS